MTAIALFLLLVPDDAPAWVQFTPKDGSFVARFPQAPGERANRTGLTWQHSAKDRVYNVARSPMPGGDEASPADVSTALDAIRDNIVKRVEAKLVSERKLEHQRIPAREYLFQLPEDKGLLRLRCFVARGSIWEIKIGGPSDYVAGREADAFLESLKIK